MVHARQRLAAGHGRLEAPALERGHDGRVERRVDPGQHRDCFDLAVRADGETGLELPLDAVGLRLRVERVVDGRRLDDRLRLGRLLFAGGVGPPPPASSRVRCVRASEIAEATLTGAAAGLARPCRPMPGPTSSPSLDMARFIATGAAATCATGAALTAFGADRLGLGDGRVGDRLGRRWRLGRLGLLLLVLHRDGDGAPAQLALLAPPRPGRRPDRRGAPRR